MVCKQATWQIWDWRLRRWWRLTGAVRSQMESSGDAELLDVGTDVEVGQHDTFGQASRTTAPQSIRIRSIPYKTMIKSIQVSSNCVWLPGEGQDEDVFASINLNRHRFMFIASSQERLMIIITMISNEILRCYRWSNHRGPGTCPRWRWSLQRCRRRSSGGW